MTRVVFDIRTFPGGNFGSDALRASQNSQLLIDTAKYLDIEITCVISGEDFPAQPFIGRREALQGLLAFVNDEPKTLLAPHVAHCLQLANVASGGRLDRVPTSGSLRGTLDLHLKAQGAKGLSTLETYLKHTQLTHSFAVVHASAGGVVRWDLIAIRTVLLSYQNRSAVSVGFSDDCGIELLAMSGTLVAEGEPLAVVRSRNSSFLQDECQGISQSYRLVAEEQSIESKGGAAWNTSVSSTRA
ncbi:hypothetical protein G7068_09810 [Leucobacter viscericola]|uniref:Uncharacterized protein n=1 Tax=Leucobacter viscericola TaxID=2714935 RepID=A0A6G7XG29_9MICO|nr:hypothetical protein [Leucobacter viscericola]QIK63462.1 hypothetical protein G7068_09810 [Leucobacter viscericola]